MSRKQLSITTIKDETFILSVWEEDPEKVVLRVRHNGINTTKGHFIPPKEIKSIQIEIIQVEIRKK